MKTKTRIPLAFHMIAKGVETAEEAIWVARLLRVMFQDEVRERFSMFAMNLIETNERFSRKLGEVMKALGFNINKA